MKQGHRRDVYGFNRSTSEMLEDIFSRYKTLHLDASKYLAAGA